jgi:hypothetical protein
VDALLGEQTRPHDDPYHALEQALRLGGDGDAG